ncbi:MAG: hypothetical protein PHR00_00605 [Patescibacteria group bacterium]|nr:hypothetical protein [Patescibacteria group bacterium]
MEQEKINSTNDIEKPVERKDEKTPETYTEELSNLIDKKYKEKLFKAIKANYPNTIKVLDFCKSLSDPLKNEDLANGEYSVEDLKSNPYYHLLMGSTPHPGLEIKENKLIQEKIKDFIKELAGESEETKEALADGEKEEDLSDSENEEEKSTDQAA